MSHTRIDGPGLGFLFSNATSRAEGAELFAGETGGSCKTAELDALYFYAFGCNVPAAAVVIVMVS